jgi:hypothetical protein
MKWGRARTTLLSLLLRDCRAPEWRRARGIGEGRGGGALEAVPMQAKRGPEVRALLCRWKGMVVHCKKTPLRKRRTRMI